MAIELDHNLKVAGSSPSPGTLNVSVLVCLPVTHTGVCKPAYGFVHLKEHLGLFKKSGGLSPVPGFYLSSSDRHHFNAVNRHCLFK